MIQVNLPVSSGLFLVFSSGVLKMARGLKPLIYKQEALQNLSMNKNQRH